MLQRLPVFLLATVAVLGAQASMAASAPAWMRAQIDAPLPAHDEKTNAVLLYSETVLTVQSNGAIKRLERKAYKILRRDGERYGTVRIDFDAQSRVIALRAWCIPTAGKDYEVKEKESVLSALVGVQNGELMSDVRSKLMRIPAATIGSIVGYEVEQEHRPYQLVEEWYFQNIIPVREAHFRLQLPRGWSHRAIWLNHVETAPVEASGDQTHWTINEIKPIKIERDMPPAQGVAARMMLTLTPPNAKDAGMQNWNDIGAWYLGLAKDRRTASPEIKKQVMELTAAAPTTVAKVRALANFVQTNIRYVAIELGIGGWQPHHAADVFINRYGDCKDKSTLLSVMLKEIGVESYYVIINTERGSVLPSSPPTLAFNHVVLAIVLPGIEDASLLASANHPKLGRLVFFDPTDSLTPFGRLNGALQANYGVLTTNEGSEMWQLPKLEPNSNSVDRTAQLTVDEKGTLRGDIHETRVGDPAASQRFLLRSITDEASRIKPVETLAAASFTSFEILRATMQNLRVDDAPFVWDYTLEAAGYAKVAGDLLLLRPRVIGSKSSNLLETKEPRVHPIEFDRPQRDKDVFEIALPKGYVVEELPEPLKMDEGFVAYESKTEVVSGKLRFTRVYEVKELSVPASSAPKLKAFYRAIENDERKVAVLKRSGA